MRDVEPHEQGAPVEPDTFTHWWWCRRCGFRRPVDDTDHCRDCAYMRGPAAHGRRRSAPRRPR